MSAVPHYAWGVSDDSSGVNILVADDEPALLRLMRRVLEGAGHCVHCAPDADLALELFLAHRDELSVAILDVIIPPAGIADSLEAMLAQRSNLAVVLSSGDVLDARVSELLTRCDGEFLHKPYLPKALLEMVERVLEKKRETEVGGGS